ADRPPRDRGRPAAGGLPSQRRRDDRRAHPGVAVLPNFHQGSTCLRGDHLFCWDWEQNHSGDTLQPALVQHVELTGIAVGIGFVLAFALAIVAHVARPIEQPIGAVAALLYTIPSIALFQLLVPF